VILDRIFLKDISGRIILDSVVLDEISLEDGHARTLEQINPWRDISLKDV